jgi:hypothetical protein
MFYTPQAAEDECSQPVEIEAIDLVFRMCNTYQHNYHTIRALNQWFKHLT